VRPFTQLVSCSRTACICSRCAGVTGQQLFAHPHRRGRAKCLAVRVRAMLNIMQLHSSAEQLLSSPAANTSSLLDPITYKSADAASRCSCMQPSTTAAQLLGQLETAELLAPHSFTMHPAACCSPTPSQTRPMPRSAAPQQQQSSPFPRKSPWPPV
jgi:hypothetical protein